MSPLSNKSSEQLVVAGFVLVLSAAGIGCAQGDEAGTTPTPPVLEAGLEAAKTEVGLEAAQDLSPEVNEGSAEAQKPDSALEDSLTSDVSDVANDVHCDAGHKFCGGSCVAEDDPQYGCASAGCSPCSQAHATSVCAGGACTIGVCDQGFADCNTNQQDGCEVSLETDHANCGSCGNDCILPNATAGCSAGLCTILSCNAGFKNCDPSTANGCEANTQLDPSHCGDCGVLCQPVGASACTNGVCQTTGCPTGKGDCDSDPDNGCEVDLKTTVAHCGYCGNACALSNATPSCVNGTCVIASCAPGFDNCDGVDANGCEVNIAESVANCGSCSAPCSTANNPSRACAAGLCSYVCAVGYADCNGPQPGVSDDGCEIWIAGDVDHCGDCSIQCQNQHGAVGCVGGVCAPVCATGYANCNGVLNDGCETAITTVSDCGACGVQCTNANGSTDCVAGACVPVCATGFGNCDTNPNNGCETPLTTTTNCGGCGVQCTNPHGTSDCVGGACQPSCAAGYGNCDSNNANGCETDLSLSYQHCGQCGNSCAADHATTTCVSGACVIVNCEALYYDVDKLASTGCEYKCLYASPTPETCDGTDENCNTVIDEGFDFQNDPNHCGNCTTSCGSSTGGLCCAGICRNSDPSNCGACNRACVPGMLVINEMLINPSTTADTQREWFELYNPNSFAIDLRGFVLDDLGTDAHTITSALPVVVPAGGLLVLGINANTATNGGAPVAYQYANFALGNSGDEVIILAHGVELDRVVYTSAFAVDGKSQELSVNHQTYQLNDSASNWCVATQVFGGGDYGTPGLPNSCSK